MKKIQTKGVKISSNKDYRDSIVDILKKMLQSKSVDAVLVPMRVPAKDSYAWILVKDEKLLTEADPAAPIMPIQGARALSSFSRKGQSMLKIAALMRPCEIRATIELSKLNQVNLENVTLISYDCPGALPMEDYLNDPEKGEKKFNDILKKLDFQNKSIKPVCKICDQFSLLPVSDLHFTLFHDQNNTMFLIANSNRGNLVLKEIGMEASHTVSAWANGIQEIKDKRAAQKKGRFTQIKKMVEGFNSLLATFSDCIGCHNCQSACPICYCRQCYFDSESVTSGTDLTMLKAKKRGSISLPQNRIMFQVGRMSHMSLSCVSCGLCTDACPVSIPVAEIFSYVAHNTQKQFSYSSGENKGEPIPLKTFKLEEVKGIQELVEDAEA